MGQWGISAALGLIIAAAAAPAWSQGFGGGQQECRVEQMDPRRGPAQQTFCRGPDGQWRARPDLDAAQGQPSSSPSAPTAPSASILPADWRGTITYSGTHEGYVQQGRPPVRELSFDSVVSVAAGGQRQHYSGRYDLVLTIDGASITGRASGTGGIEAATLTGTRTGSLCRLYMEGAELEATCTTDQFVGASRSPRGASPSFLMNIDTRATRVVDTAEEERQRAAAEERAREQRAAAEAAERARIAAMPAATAAQAQMVERAVAQDSGAWWVNRYDVGSVTNVRVAERDDGVTTLRAEYTFNGGSPGWVLARIRGGAVECLGYWDMGGCSSVRSAAQTAASTPSVRTASSGGVPIADKSGSTACLRRRDGGESRGTVVTDDTLLYFGEEELTTHDVLESARFVYANVCNRPIEYELGTGSSNFNNNAKQTFTLEARSEHRWYCDYSSGENAFGMVITIRNYCERE